MDSTAFNPDELGEEWKDYDFEKIPPNLLSTRKRSYLVHSEGEVDVFDHVDGKTVGLYFSAGPCQYFTLKLADVYNELSANGGFEVVYVSSDDDHQLFDKEFADMPWLAVPYDDSETRDMLTNSFKVPGFPHLVFLDEFGKVLSDEGVEIIESYGVKGYPFTLRRLEELKEQEEAAAKSNQSSKSIFVSDSREFLHSADGKEGYGATKAKSAVYFGFKCTRFRNWKSWNQENRVKELDENLNKVARWPKKLKYKLHLAHELLLNHSQVYTCKKCNKTGCFWVFSCKECQYNIHPCCAL